MSKQKTIVATITFTPNQVSKDITGYTDLGEAMVASIMNGANETISEMLAEYRNYKFVKDFTVEVKEQDGD